VTNLNEREAGTSDSGTFKRSRVLVVDDSPAICKSISEVLIPAGCEVQVAHNGLDAISAIKTKRFDLVTLDVEMPGMAGIDVLRIIKAYDPDLYVVMISSLSNLQTALHAIRQGAYDYINKPFEAEDMLLSIWRALKQRSLTFENRKLIADLKALNENLENLVEVRTQELNEAHQKLLQNHEQLEETYLKLKELDQLKQKFITIASHELKTPLTTLRGYSALLATSKLPTPAQQEKAFGALERNIERLNGIVMEITDISRLREKRMYLAKHPTCVPNIIRDVIEEMQPFVSERNQNIETSWPDGLPEANIDGNRIRQVLVNLVTNAIRFTPDKGVIKVSVSVPAMHPGFLQLTVADTGIGIPPREIERIFEEFYESGPVEHHHSGTIEFKSGGIGLGLSLVKGIIAEHGGHVWAENATPGSRFHILLPIT